MSMSAQAYDQYKKTSVETLSPGKLLIMLYEGAIKNVRNARRAIQDNNLNQAHIQLLKAQDILIELMATLNMDYKISESLYALYEYLHNRLVDANVNKDILVLDEVEGFLHELRDTWQEVVKMQAGNNAPVVEGQSLNFRG